jgi:hypothetical protein
VGCRLVVLLFIVAATATGCGTAGKTSEPTTGFSFEPRDGWFTAERVEQPDAQVPALSIAWAADVPFTSAQSAWPDATIRALPPRGIVLVAVGPWTYTGDEDVPRVEFPVRLADGYCLADGYEGQPAPNVALCAVSARVGEQLMNAYAYFGANEPSVEMKAAADEMLASLAISR